MYRIALTYVCNITKDVMDTLEGLTKLDDIEIIEIDIDTAERIRGNKNES